MTSITTEEILKQTSLLDHDVMLIKQIAAKKNILLKELYPIAIRNFIHYRKKLQDADRPVIYFASPKNGKELNIKLEPMLSRRISMIAHADSTSVRRFLFTALQYYINANK